MSQALYLIYWPRTYASCTISARHSINHDRISSSMSKSKAADRRSRRAPRTTELKTEAIERLEKLATDLADVTAEASAVAEIVREGLAVEETNQAAAGPARQRKGKQTAR